MLRGMFGGHAHGDAILTTREMLQIGLVTAGMIVVHWTLRDSNIETAVMRLAALDCGGDMGLDGLRHHSHSRKQ